VIVARRGDEPRAAAAAGTMLDGLLGRGFAAKW